MAKKGAGNFQFKRGCLTTKRDSKTFMFCICEIQQDVSKWFKACQILLLHICILYKIMSNYVYAGCSAMHL